MFYVERDPELLLCLPRLEVEVEVFIIRDSAEEDHQREDPDRTPSQPAPSKERRADLHDGDMAAIHRTAEFAVGVEQENQ